MTLDSPIIGGWSFSISHEVPHHGGNRNDKPVSTLGSDEPSDLPNTDRHTDCVSSITIRDDLKSFADFRRLLSSDPVGCFKTMGTEHNILHQRHDDSPQSSVAKYQHENARHHADRGSRLCELAKPEIVRNGKFTVFINPTAQTLLSVLRKSEAHSVRAIGFGDDVAIVDAYRATHHDISTALETNVHPMVELNRMYWEPMEIRLGGIGKHNVLGLSTIVSAAGDSLHFPIPEDRWPLALRRILTAKLTPP